jgi:hypothetical protein
LFKPFRRQGENVRHLLVLLGLLGEPSIILFDPVPSPFDRTTT